MVALAVEIAGGLRGEERLIGEVVRKLDRRVREVEREVKLSIRVVAANTVEASNVGELRPTGKHREEEAVEVSGVLILREDEVRVGTTRDDAGILYDAGRLGSELRRHLAVLRLLRGVAGHLGGLRRVEGATLRRGEEVTRAGREFHRVVIVRLGGDHLESTTERKVG